MKFGFAILHESETVSWHRSTRFRDPIFLFFEIQIL